MDSLRKFIEQYVSLNQGDWQTVSSHFKLTLYPKGSTILESGKICDHLAFLEKGLLRFFIWKEGVDSTKFFTVAPYLFTSQRSFNTRRPATETIEALEDCHIWQIHFDDHKRLLKLPVYNELAQKITQEVQFFTENILFELQNQTAEQRYNNLLSNRPELLQRVQLKHLASYLGVTQQSLSRIRKNI
ncbi:Crp/Fnr family transcriptional regulator [Costertonia aggregata]|uniref:Crp/Fnr family transcriptional regulator n=1 Tax=Costertonia aggregata TaxID=343403 RepID=A0A7H9AVU4_9FLAO|nr:Crp/Fnr family transcriptional regulator [Costertonia aggregata]